MAHKGTPLEGLVEIAEQAYKFGGDFTLVAYTNAANSLGPNSVAADLIQPTVANGYAPITLAAANFAVANGIVTYDHGTPDSPTWTASGTWSAPVTGVAMLRNGRLVHFRDFDDAGGTWIASLGRKLEVSIPLVLS